MESQPPAPSGNQEPGSGNDAGAGQRYAVGPRLRSHLFGETFQAQDQTTGKTVALTLVWPDLVPSSGAHADRLHETVSHASRLEHKSIASVQGSGLREDRLFVAHEHFAGDTLRVLIEKKRQTQKFYSLSGACNVALHVVAALDYAHAQVPHGALTPSSILVTPEGRVKLLDFGLGALAQQARERPGEGASDLTYLSSASEDGDGPARADLRAIGLLLHELLTGVVPTTAYESRPEIPKEIDGVLRRLLGNDAEERYQDARSVKDDLLAIVSSFQKKGAGTMPPKPPTTGKTSTRPPRPPIPTPVSGIRPLTPVMGVPVGGPPPRTSTPAASVPRAPAGNVPRPPPTPVSGVAILPRGPNTARSMAFAVKQAGGPVDETVERWLIHKDRLDFGPFSLAAVKEKIRKGEFGAESVIVDQSTGARLTIGSHPLLAEVVKEVEHAQERRRREAADHAHRKADRRVRLLIAAVVMGVVLVLVGGVMVFVKRQKPIVKEKIVYREKEQNLEGLLKGIDIAWKAPPPPKKRKRRSSSGKPGQPAEVYDEFDAPLELGDASKGGGDEQLSRTTIEKVMRQNFSKLTSCVLEEKRRNASLTEVHIEFLVKGTGKVSAVRTNGDKAGPLQECMLAKMKRIDFPTFNGPRTRAGFSMSLR